MIITASGGGGGGQYEHAVEACTKPLDSQVFYRNAADHGLRYGNWFQLLEDLYWDGKMTAVAHIDVSKPQFHTTSLVHPAVLDTVFHMLRASSQAFASASAANVPVKLTSAWFSSSGWKSPQTGSLRCWGTANTEPDDDIGEDGTIYTLGDNGKVLMSIEHLVTVAVSRVDEGDSPATTRKLLHSVQWKPQLSLLDPRQLTQACVRSRVVKDDATVLAHHLELTSVINLVLCRTLGGMTAAEREKLPASLERHMAWMELRVGTLEPAQKEGNPDAPISEKELEQRLRNIEAMHPAWRLHTNVVRELKNINNVARYMIASLFYFELASVPQRSGGRYVGTGHILCSIRRNDPAFRLLFDRLSRNSAQFWVSSCPVIDVDDSCFGGDGNFQKQVELNTYNRFAIALKQDSSEPCNISGSPFSITKLILLQGFSAVFGRPDHRKRKGSGYSENPKKKHRKVL